MQEFSYWNIRGQSEQAASSGREPDCHMAVRVVEQDNGRSPQLSPALSSTDLVYFITNKTKLREKHFIS